MYRTLLSLTLFTLLLLGTSPALGQTTYTVSSGQSIQAAIDGANNGDIIEVGDGTYEENITIDKSLTLLAPDGRDVTTIQGSLDGPGFGTINIANGVDDVTIGAVGQGFTIVGFPLDNAAQEGAAIRFSGASTGSKIIGNELVADGEAALLVTSGVVVQNLTVDANIISGQTFEGTPAGEGFGTQFSTLNVPRQLVVVNPGTGGNINFTNNEVIGIAGGINADGNPQGNTLVTIDRDNSTISDNTFAGTTTRFGSSLRVRGSGATIEDNTFESDGLTPSNLHLFLQNNTLDNALVGANTFDKGVYVEGGEGIGHVIQPAVDVVPPGTVLNVLSGTYEESITIDKALTIQASAVASSKPVIIGQSTNAVRVEASDVTISGLDIQNPEGGGANPSARNAVGIRVLPNSERVTISDNHIQNIATAVETNPLGIVAFDGANNLTIQNNTLQNLKGTTTYDEQAQAILLIQESISAPTAITDALIKGNTITNVSDARSAVAIRFNGDVQGTIEDNTISSLFTTVDDPTRGFTQAIAFAKGGNGDDAPSNVTIKNNTISDLEDNGTDNLAPSHVIFTNIANASTVTITNNTFNAATVDEAYIVDVTPGLGFALEPILNDNDNAYNPTAEIISGDSFRAIVPVQGCPPADLVENRDGIPDGFITVTADDPEGVVEVAFVDEDGNPALTNFDASTESEDFETLDGITFTLKDGATVPTNVEFKLTAVPPPGTEPGEEVCRQIQQDLF